MVAFIVRDRLGMVLAVLTGLSFCAFVFDPQSVIWNERLIPYWYISIHLIAGWLVGYLAYRWANRVRWREARAPVGVDTIAVGTTSSEWTTLDASSSVTSFVRMSDQWRDDAIALEHDGESPATPVETKVSTYDDDQRRIGRTLWATIAVGVLGLLTTVPGLIAPVASALHLNTSGNQVTGWAQYNYEGYQAQAAWPEYHNLMALMSSLSTRYGCGRAMWEYNSSEGRFGTPEALMLLPYWTNNCVDSMEGLFFESSATTPYHFLNQSELSASPSDAQVGLEYGGVNVALGVRHLQLLGVKYFMAFSPNVIAEANADPSLRLIASTRAWPTPGVRWRIYLVKDSPMVQPLTYLPTVVANVSSRVNWLAANQQWWLNQANGQLFGAESGPASWPRSPSIAALSAAHPLPSVKVSRVKVATQSISFHVSRVGVPVLVKISYFPRWHVSGATGPYRVSPNLMVVVPTSKDVTLVYGSTPALEVGNLVTDVTVITGAVVAWFALRRRRMTRQ